MRLWKRASGALKDKNSLFKTRLIRGSAFRNPEIEKAVIKATSHDELHMDFRHTQCIFAWIHISEANFRPILWAISARMRRTHNWAVALKGLILMNGVFCCDVPAVQTIGQLPFDLSDFKHGYSRSVKRWSLEAFIREYYAYLDQKSMFLYLHSQQRNDDQEMSDKSLILEDLVWLQKLQSLLDMLLKIKPRYAAKTNLLVLEAMDCLVVESYDTYSRICDGISNVLTRINSAGITEAKITLSVLEKATAQCEKLSQYLDFCRNIGVVNASECPKVEQISQVDIRDLENLIKNASDQSETKRLLPKEEQKSVIIEKTETHEANDSRSGLKTIMTEEDQKKPDQQLDLISFDSPMETGKNNTNPFGPCNTHELPDLISF